MDRSLSARRTPYTFWPDGPIKLTWRRQRPFVSRKGDLFHQYKVVLLELHTQARNIPQFKHKLNGNFHDEAGFVRVQRKIRPVFNGGYSPPLWRENCPPSRIFLRKTSHGVLIVHRTANSRRQVYTLMYIWDGGRCQPWTNIMCWVFCKSIRVQERILTKICFSYFSAIVWNYKAQAQKGSWRGLMEGYHCLKHDSFVISREKTTKILMSQIT